MKIEGSAQNSIKSLEEADRIKVYGSEFDVHLTADNEAIVFHDNKVNDIKVQEVNYDKLQDIQQIPTTCNAIIVNSNPGVILEMINI